MTRRDLYRLERLLRELNSVHSEVRIAALEQVRALPPEHLLRLAEIDTQRTRRWRSQGYLRLGLLVVIPVAFAYIAPVIGADWTLLFLLMLVVVSYLRERTTPAHRAIASLLGEMKDPRFIGPAVEMVLESNVKASNATMNSILRALKRMTRQLRADQSEMLTKKQKQALLTLLQTPYADFELMVSILKALEQVGDADAIPVVERLTEQSVEKVRIAAEECLGTLRVRARQNEQAQTLLRACANASIAPETLLRPACAVVNETRREHLLRPLAGESPTSQESISEVRTACS